jgi:pimeloyl-ACP methyl ester carboxylesterase
VRSLTVLEPPIDELLADLPEVESVRDERAKSFEPIRTAALSGDVIRAAALFFDLANNQGPGTFDQQPETFRQMVLDNAKTIPLQLLSLRDRPTISRIALSGLKVPTLVVGGERSPQYCSLINEVVAQSVPSSGLVVIPGGAHLMSYQNPTAFNDALLDFLAQ